MKHKAYICSNDATYHIPDDYDGVTMYFSEESIREHCKCITDDSKYGCKVVQIEIDIPDEVDGD
jgi:hypothetical protein